MSLTRPSVFYIDLLRCLAALAVVAIHVLGPLRELLGSIPNSQWLAAVSINAVTRWAVPVFIMISGALLLSTDRDFKCDQYVTKRLFKVAVPFIGWSLIYVFVAGVTNGQWHWSTTLELISQLPNEPGWYHLWFFYDFIPLYFVIPFLALGIKKCSPEHLKFGLYAWGLLTLMHWLDVETVLRENLLLYSGYLVLGWYLFNRDNRAELRLWLFSGAVMLLGNIIGTACFSFEQGEYSSFFMGYKTLNTVIIGGMIFVVAQCYAEQIKGRWRAFISLIAKYSLGIYLLHPILLLPVRDLDNGVYDWFYSYWIAIPIITVITLLVSLLLTVLLARFPVVHRLVP